MHKALLLLLFLLPTALVEGTLGYCQADVVIKKIDPVQEKCLATMVYGEARGESIQGQIAVAHTALNRTNKGRNKTVCDVVLAPKQYSIFNGNPALYAAATSLHIEPTQKNKIDRESWQRAVDVAKAVLNKSEPDPTFGATHYIAPAVMKLKKYRYPKWSKLYTKVAVIENHHFYVAGKHP